MALPDPHPDDRVVTDALGLAVALNGSIGETVSIRVAGHIRLGELATASARTLAPWIGTGMSVTIWSSDRAILDAEGAGRHFFVNGGALRLEGVSLAGGLDAASSADGGGGGCVMAFGVTSLIVVHDAHFIDCSTTAWGGGALAIFGGTVNVSSSTFEQCEVRRSFTGNAYGGGVSVAGFTTLLALTDVTFTRTRAVAAAGIAYGGAVGSFGGTTTMERVAFIGTECDGETSAFGGGVGVNSGKVIVAASTWLGTAVVSPGRAWGGGVGTNVGGRAIVYDSFIANCTATSADASEGRGGGAAAGMASTLALFNVTLDSSGASTPGPGRALYAHDPFDLTAAQLAIRGACAPDDTESRLVGSDTAGRMLLRDLSLDVPGCTLPPVGTYAGFGDLTLVQCGDPSVDVCGPWTACTMTDDVLVSTPLCACAQPSDRTLAFLEPEPAPGARRPELAPYTEAGCVGFDSVPLASRQLNPNWWRAAADTDDVRECVAFWREGDPTPCRGGSLEDGTYCEPGHSGARCRACTSDSQYYDIRAASCTDCPSGPALVLPILAVLILVLGAIVMPFATRRWRQKRNSSMLRRLESAAAIVPRLGLIGKLKIAVGYFQVVLVFPEAFDVEMPPDYVRWMGAFQWISFDWFNAFVPGACVGGFRARLLLRALGPLVFLALLVVGSGAAAAGRDAARAGASSAPHAAGAVHKMRVSAEPDDSARASILAAAREGALYTMPFVLATLFALVPSVCARIFSTFSCEQFSIEDGEGGTPRRSVEFLFADPKIECGSAEHTSAVELAIFLILLWPIGVPLLFWVLMRADTVGSTLWRATEFLHAEYDDAMCHWEVRPWTSNLRSHTPRSVKQPAKPDGSNIRFLLLCRSYSSCFASSFWRALCSSSRNRACAWSWPCSLRSATSPSCRLRLPTSSSRQCWSPPVRASLCFAPSSSHCCWPCTASSRDSKPRLTSSSAPTVCCRLQSSSSASMCSCWLWRLHSSFTSGASMGSRRSASGRRGRRPCSHWRRQCIFISSSRTAGERL